MILFAGRSVTLPAYGVYDHHRTLLRLLLSSNESNRSNVSNTANHPSSDQHRFKTHSIFVCIPSSDYEIFFRTYIPIFDILLVAAIPFCLLCFTNTGIIVYTMRANRRMLQHRKHSHRRHQRLTIMLLSVTLAFIGLTCPSVIFICLNKIIYSRRIINERKESSNEAANMGPPSNIQLIIDICEALWYTKHAMNFILYTLSGQDFRREFLKLFTQSRCHRFIFVRLLLNKSRMPTQSNMDTELSMIRSQMNSRYEKKHKRATMSEAGEVSSAILID
jgi:hypothetical protein